MNIPKRILIAEDDPYSLLILRMMLEKEPGWEVVTSVNGNEAWEKLQAGPPFDVCIFDIMMPELDGLHLAAKLRADPRFVAQPIIFCTALNDRATVQQAVGLLAKHYLVKPLRKDLVIRQVREVMAQGVAVVHVQPTEQVAERLGITPEQVREMIGGLQTEIGRVTQEMKASPGEADAFAMKINGFKGAATNLGVPLLAEQLAALEAAITRAEKKTAIHQLPEFQWVMSETQQVGQWVSRMQPQGVSA